MTKQTKAQRKAASAAEKKKHQGPKVELSADEQARQINQTLGEAVKRGMPSAAAMQGMHQLAVTAWNSGNFKTSGGPAGLLVKMMYGHEIGLPPMLSLINIDIVDGHPAMSTQLMSAVFGMAGGRVEWLERSHTATRLILHYKGTQMDFEFTIDDVNRARLQGKDNHQKYPKAMMGYRALSDGIKTLAPEVMLKCYTFGELTDDRAHDLSSLEAFNDLPLLEGPAAKKDQHAAPQQSTSTTTSTRPSPAAASNSATSKPTAMATKQKIVMIRKSLESPAVPHPLKVTIIKWLEANNITDSAASKALAKLQPFQVTSTVKKQNEAATGKQVNLLAGLTADPRLPAGTANFLNAMDAQLTMAQCSAWIACFDWFIASAMKDTTHPKPASDVDEINQQPDRPLNDEDLPFENDGSLAKPVESVDLGTGEISEDSTPDTVDDYAARVVALKNLIKSKVPPADKDLDAVNGFLEWGKHNETILNEYENQVMIWQDKPTVQEDLVK